MTTQPWHGVVVASALPFNADMSVDYQAFADHVRWLAQNGCHGVTPNGSLGEYQTLNPQERAKVVEVAVDAAPDGFSVVPGTGAYGSGEAVAWARQAKEAGAQAVLSLAPNAYRADDDIVVAHYEEVASAGLPVVAYNNPLDTKVDLSPELLARLHAAGLIVAVKEFSGDVRRIYQIQELAPELEVLVGTDDCLLELAIAGATGWIAGYPNALPAASVQCGSSPRPVIWTTPFPCTATCIRCCVGTPSPSSSKRSSCRWTWRDVRAVRAVRRVCRCPRTWRIRCAKTPKRLSPTAIANSHRIDNQGR